MNSSSQENVAVEKPTIFGALTNPTEQFERIRRNPKFGLALVLFIIMGAILTGITTYITINDPSLMPTPIASDVTIDMKTMNMVLMITGAVTGAIMVVIAAAICALITWLLVTLFQGEITFKQAFSLFIHLSVITYLSLMINITMYYLFQLSPAIPVTSLASVIEAKGFWHGILSHIDVFQIVYTALLAKGLQIVGKLSASKSWTIAILFWLLGALFVACFK
ncbi:Yip1 family protein [Thermoactinomyces sp. DSM 45892]|uniref:Yip1 family protein n=1 Tax=Thermoactinomyces sp. DSM 45892 TaxID=1882753 RepID=UPI0008978BF7|nr:Yip1 family protein [Thermoactinomyces sp. DSM 45892]SDY02633.1 Yip1 domain-containing protein [Thermoactinomyces sp. DSM 45892]